MAKDKENTKNFVLRLDAKTMEAVEKWAADEFRSVNGQLQWIITEALKKNKRINLKDFNHDRQNHDNRMDFNHPGVRNVFHNADNHQEY
ncbi:MAG: Arc family DNA-binding protein [Bacteroidales bacterium]|nr:Arc family DNA-binding protein [Bacteroidales bacterium]